MFPEYQLQLQSYTHCVGNSTHTNDNSSLSLCLSPLQPVCGLRFGDPHTSDICAANLQYLRQPYVSDVYPASELQVFTEYVACAEQEREKLVASGCDVELETVCRSKYIRAMKTVRVNMEVVERLLTEMPSLKVIYLVRDPRGILLSRKEIGWDVQGSLSKDNLTHEAILLCNQMLDDLRGYQALHAAHPSSVMKLIYEDFIQDPYGQTQHIYSFIGAYLPTNVHQWLATNINRATPDKWKQGLSPDEVHNITEICRPVYNMAQVKAWS